MGKSKGGKYFKPPRSRRPGGTRGEEGEEEGSGEEFVEQQRGLGGQRATVGMLPPSDSEEEKEKDGKEVGDASKATAAKPAKKDGGGQPATAGQLPPNSDDDEEDEGEDDESSSSDEEPLNEYLSGPSNRAKRAQAQAQSQERDAETIRKDLERLELIRKKREDDRKKRIADEGWDRFAPVSETNRPPGHVPADHPSNAAK